jgi:hypothetical protein
MTALVTSVELVEDRIAGSVRQRFRKVGVRRSVGSLRGWSTRAVGSTALFHRANSSTPFASPPTDEFDVSIIRLGVLVSATLLTPVATILFSSVRTTVARLFLCGATTLEMGQG